MIRVVSSPEACVRAVLPQRSWLRALRVGQWAHFALLPLAAFEPSRGRAGLVALARGALVACSVLGSGYLLNALADRKMDRPGKNPLAEHDVADAWTGVLLLGALATGASALGPPVVRVATAVCLVSGALYSVGPRIKAWPLLGTLANATNFAPLLWVGAAGQSGGTPPGPPGGETLPWMVPITVAFVCLLLQGQLLHEAVDRAEDHAGGVRTTVLFAGDRWAAALASGLGFGLVALAWRLHGAWFAWPLAVVYGGAFPVVLASRGSDHEAMTRARRAHRLSALVTGAWILVWLR